jgi:type I restriction enzyme S subunit
VDTLIAKKVRISELLREKRQALITQAVTTGLDPSVPMKDSGLESLGRVPEHWKVTRFKYLVQHPGGLQMGPFGTSLKEAVRYEEDEFKVYGQENTISGVFGSGSRWTSSSWFEQLRQYELCPGDIVMTRKGSLGNCRLVPPGIQRGIIDSDTIRVRLLREQADPAFLVRVLHEAHYLAEQLEETKRGAILSGLNTSTVGDLVMSVPPLAEQREIMAAVQRRCDMDDRIAEQTQRSIERLGEYRQALIMAAVTGRIDVSREAA